MEYKYISAAISCASMTSGIWLTPHLELEVLISLRTSSLLQSFHLVPKNRQNIMFPRR